MNLHDSFLRSIAESVYDDAPRLIYADWLEDHGDSIRAEFIRVQCELEPMRDRYGIDRAAELHRREDELLHAHQRDWLKPGLEDWDRWREDGASTEFRRGFVDTIITPASTFLKLGEGARRCHPTIRRVILFRVHGHGTQLAESAALDGLAELELAGWYSDADAEAIASSSRLKQLQVLELWLGRRGRLKDTRLCQVMAGAKAWPNLRELALLNPNDENERGRKRLVATADAAAGRDIAVYRRGWPTHFPFAADFFDVYPGYLPDGRMAMAAEDGSTTPPSLCVITFDKKGKQTKDILTVPFPEDVQAIPPDMWYNHKDRLKKHLIDTIGFRPGFIYIQDCRFPVQTEYNRPWWAVYSTQGEEREFGVPDRDDGWWANEPRGYAGEFAHRRRAQEWVFGWDRMADKRGWIHST